MTAEHAPEQIARAFEIADQAMFEQLCGECVSLQPEIEELDVITWGLVDECCEPVTTLAAAAEAIQEAFNWLMSRGIVDLCSDEGGEYIAVVRRPWE